ncbi:MAG TPA: NADPH-dependent ferric siderophore reductase [Streptomyces sp.]|nr:NADPH-dependent ferric siderophore reductase [Streptomyces sp.]
MPDRPVRQQPQSRRARVIRTERLTPLMVRVVLGGDGLAGLEAGKFTDHYIKLLFPVPGVTHPEPFDIARIRAELPRDQWPRPRTYTVRSWDADARELAVDFVVHGDEGLAAPWAAACRPGDQVIARGPGGKWAPSPEADWHLFVGDESSIPAIEVGLAALPADARGLALIEVGEHTVALAAPEGVEVRWLVRGDEPYREDRLAAELGSLPWEGLGDVDVFAHGERGAMKALRAVFRDRGVPSERLSISGYWALGRKEDEFQAEKRTELGRI